MTAPNFYYKGVWFMPSVLIQNTVKRVERELIQKLGKGISNGLVWQNAKSQEKSAPLVISKLIELKYKQLCKVSDGIHSGNGTVCSDQTSFDATLQKETVAFQHARDISHLKSFVASKPNKSDLYPYQKHAAEVVHKILCEHCGAKGSLGCISCKQKGSFVCSHCEGQKYFLCKICKGNGSAYLYGSCLSCNGAGTLGGSSVSDGAGGYRYQPAQCNTCGGTGSSNQTRWCIGCSGKGKNKCSTCDGRGGNTCNSCSGKGRITCKYCRGKKFKSDKRSFYSEVKVTFTVASNRFFNVCETPDAFIKTFGVDNANESTLENGRTIDQKLTVTPMVVTVYFEIEGKTFDTSAVLNKKGEIIHIDLNPLCEEIIQHFLCVHGKKEPKWVFDQLSEVPFILDSLAAGNGFEGTKEIRRFLNQIVPDALGIVGCGGFEKCAKAAQKAFDHKLVKLAVDHDGGEVGSLLHAVCQALTISLHESIQTFTPLSKKGVSLLNRFFGNIYIEKALRLGCTYLNKFNHQGKVTGVIDALNQHYFGIRMASSMFVGDSSKTFLDSIIKHSPKLPTSVFIELYSMEGIKRVVDRASEKGSPERRSIESLFSELIEQLICLNNHKLVSTTWSTVDKNSKSFSVNDNRMKILLAWRAFLESPIMRVFNDSKNMFGKRVLSYQLVSNSRDKMRFKDLRATKRESLRYLKEILFWDKLAGEVSAENIEDIQVSYLTAMGRCFADNARLLSLFMFGYSACVGSYILVKLDEGGVIPRMFEFSMQEILISFVVVAVVIKSLMFLWRFVSTKRAFSRSAREAPASELSPIMTTENAGRVLSNQQRLNFSIQKFYHDYPKILRTKMRWFEWRYALLYPLLSVGFLIALSFIPSHTLLNGLKEPAVLFMERDQLARAKLDHPDNYSLLAQHYRYLSLLRPNNREYQEEFKRYTHLEMEHEDPITRFWSHKISVHQNAVKHP